MPFSDSSFGRVFAVETEELVLFFTIEMIPLASVSHFSPLHLFSGCFFPLSGKKGQKNSAQCKLRSHFLS
jgi:hypothetical protein